MLRRLTTVAVLTALLMASTATVRAAGADHTGNDVSYPQCGRALPVGAAFGIVGVNGGKASTLNPCFAAQLAWAKQSVGGTGQPAAAVYVNTGNPGDVYLTTPSSVSFWPSGGANSFGVCSGGNTAACAYEYGRT